MADLTYRVRCDACRQSDERTSDGGSFNVQHGCYTSPTFVWTPVSTAVVTPSQADRQPHPDVMGTSAQSRADKIAAAIVPDQLDQYLPASETKGGKSSVEVFDKRTGDC